MLSLLLCMPLWLQAAHIDTLSVYSSSMRKQIPVCVVLPEGYEASQKSLPVLYLLHGHGGDHLNYLARTDLGKLADRHGFMVVCPSAGNNWYWDLEHMPEQRYETFVSSELVAHVDSAYRTLPGKQGRGIAGLSMGGHGALYLAARHPEVFGAAASMSGGVDLMPFPKNWNLAALLGPQEQHADRWRAHTVLAHVPQLKAAGMPLWIDCGTEDFFMEVNRNLHQALLQAQVPHSYQERPGAHNWTYWGESLAYQAEFFSRFFVKAEK